jgi:hypothetical protein
VGDGAEAEDSPDEVHGARRVELRDLLLEGGVVVLLRKVQWTGAGIGGVSDASPARALDRFLHRYNHHRHHTAIGGPPASRVNNLARHNN